MGAGASAASMSIAERRQMYEVLKEKYTRSDIDTLAEEEKRAWLEVLEEQSEPAAASELCGTSPSAAEADVAVAAATAAACTASVDNGTSCGEGGVRAQGRKTRMSYNLLPEEVLTAAKPSNDDGEKQPTPDQDACGLATDGGPPPCTELPAWRRTAELVENASELCVGDVVRARDVECNGMWFEGVLTAINDESSFLVEMTGGAAGETVDSITVGVNDIVRVMPWFCIEVGDPVECQPEGTMWWVRGTVVNIALSEGLYDVVLESGALADSDQDMEGLSEGGKQEQSLQQEEGRQKEAENAAVAYRITESRIRKIGSGRQATASGGIEMLAQGSISQTHPYLKLLSGMPRTECNGGDGFMTKGEEVLSFLEKLGRQRAAAAYQGLRPVGRF